MLSRQEIDTISAREEATLGDSWESMPGLPGWIQTSNQIAGAKIHIADIRGFGDLTCRMPYEQAEKILNAHADFVVHSKEDIRALVQSHRELRELLKKVEHAEMGEKFDYCPICKEPDYHEHKPDCEMGRALA